MRCLGFLILTSMIWFGYERLQPENYSGDLKIQNITNTSPKFPGGEEALKKFVDINGVYPLLAKNAWISGNVVVKIIVNEKGHIVNVELIRSTHQSLTAEAYRLISIMPKWLPATVAGNSTTAEIHIAVRFNVERKYNSRLGINEAEESIDIILFELGSSPPVRNESLINFPHQVFSERNIYLEKDLDVLPEFKHGDDSMRYYFIRNLSFPVESKFPWQYSIGFVVEPDGTASNFFPLNFSLNQEISKNIINAFSII